MGLPGKGRGEGEVGGAAGEVEAGQRPSRKKEHLLLLLRGGGVPPSIREGEGTGGGHSQARGQEEAGGVRLMAVKKSARLRSWRSRERRKRI